MDSESSIRVSCLWRSEKCEGGTIVGSKRSRTVFHENNFKDYFAFFTNETKGVYFFLGGSNFSKGITSMPHAPNFNVDENSIKKGVNYFSSLIYELGNNPKELKPKE